MRCHTVNRALHTMRVRMLHVVRTATSCRNGSSFMLPKLLVHAVHQALWSHSMRSEGLVQGYFGCCAATVGAGQAAL